MTYELTFWGDVPARDRKFIRPAIKSKHPTYEAAREEAYRVLCKLSERNAHPAIIYGPGCGKDGRTIG